MGFDVAPSGPMARLLARALTTDPLTPMQTRRPYVPTADPWHADDDIGLPVDATIERCHHLLRATLGAEPFDAHADWLLPNVLVWTPLSQARGLAEVVGSTRELGTTLTEVEVHIAVAEVAGSRAFLEWRLSGRFTEPCFVDDDLLVEPTARLVETAGVLVATFTGDLVSSLHCYFDELGLLEQLFTNR